MRFIHKERTFALAYWNGAHWNYRPITHTVDINSNEPACGVRRGKGSWRFLGAWYSKGRYDVGCKMCYRKINNGEPKLVFDHET